MPKLAQYIRQLYTLPPPARWYLLHAALLTGALAIGALFYNLTIDALGYQRIFLGQLETTSRLAALVLVLPLWWLVHRVGLRQALMLSAGLHALSAWSVALWPAAAPLLLASAATGPAAVLFQVSAAPLMMAHSSAAQRDRLFSLNAALNIGVAGLSKWLGSALPGLLAPALGVAPNSALAYRATFGVAGLLLVLAIVPLLRLPRRAPAADSEASALSDAVPEPDAETNTVQKRASQSLTTKTPGALWAARRASEADKIFVPSRLRSYLRAMSSGRSQAALGRFSAWLAGLAAPIARRLPEPWSSVARDPLPILLILLPPLLISAGAALLIPYLNIFLATQYAASNTAIGSILAGGDIAAGLAMLAAPLLSARLGKIGAVALTQLLSIPFLLLSGFAPSLLVAGAALILRSGLFNLGVPLYDAFAMERSPASARPVVIGLVNGAYAAGYLLAPLISTRVQQFYGFAPLFIATACCYALAALAMLALFGRGLPQMAETG